MHESWDTNAINYDSVTMGLAKILVPLLRVTQLIFILISNIIIYEIQVSPPPTMGLRAHTNYNIRALNSVIQIPLLISTSGEQYLFQQLQSLCRCFPCVQTNTQAAVICYHPHYGIVANPQYNVEASGGAFLQLYRLLVCKFKADRLII